MFYAHFVLASKGPLARIWLAAHWDKKLTKSHVFETNIESSVEGILQPKVKMALRTSGHLLLGIVRIYSRKAKYLLADCNEAYIKMRMAFRPGVVDLPEAAREAAVATITLPEVFHDFDSVPDIAIDFDNEVTLNQSRAEDITLKEDYGNLNLITEENFDAFDEHEANRDPSNMDEGFENSNVLDDVLQSQTTDEKEGEDNSKGIMAQSNACLNNKSLSYRDDGFGGTCGVGLLEDAETGGLFEPSGLFDDTPLDNMAVDNVEPSVEPPLEKPSGPPSAQPAPTEDNDSDDDMYDMGGGMSPGCPSGPSSPECENNEVTEPEKLNLNSQADNQINSTPLVPEVTAPEMLSPVPEVPPPPEAPPVLDHQVSNEEETFALAPLDTTIVHGAERTVKAKRKRKLIVDDVKNISGEEMKAQLSDTTDIVVTLDLAPPTKRLMLWKESGGVEKLFALSGLRILSRRLACQYQLHLSTRTQGDDFQDDLLHTLEELPRKDEPEDIGLNNGPARKRPRRDMNESIFPQFGQMDNHNASYFEKDPNYSDHNLTHPPRAPSIGPTNYLPEQMLISPQHDMMGNVMQHPPPAHMMSMFPPNVPDPLVQLPDNLLQPHPVSMVNQTSLSMSSSIPNIASPVMPDAFNPPRFLSPDKNMHSIVPPLDSQQTHLLSHNDTMPNQTANQSSMNQFQDQLPHPTDSPNIMENNMQPHSHILNQAPQVDEDATCLNEDYVNALNNTNALPPTDALLAVSEKEPLEDRNLVDELVNHAVNQEKSPELSAFDQLAQQPSHNLTENSIVENSTAEKNDAEKADFNMSDDDDYGAPASVGPTLPEEQMADETYEQFEERILSKRTTHMLHVINGKLDRDGSIHFADVVRNNKRKQVAQKFYTFLVLKKQQAVELEQSESYGDLVITKGPKFDAVYNAV